MSVLPGSDATNIGSYALALTFWRCPKCGVILREDRRSPEARQQYIDQAGYVLPSNSELILGLRQPMYADVVRRASNCLPNGKQKTVLDFGCSYGHLALMFKKAGWKVIGVDAAKPIRDHHNQAGTFPVVDQIDSPSIPDGGVDAVAMIDVLYYLPDPMAVLETAWRKLASPGVLLLRVPNRGWYLRHALRWHRWVGRKRLSQIAYDHLTYWTAESIRIAARKVGFDSCRMLWRERGYQYHNLRQSLFHRATQALAALTRGAVLTSTVFHAELWKGR